MVKDGSYSPWVKNINYLDPKKVEEITKEESLLFFAYYYYMGYCWLPVRHDYWRIPRFDSYLPAHWMNDKLTCDKFDFIWRNIHLGRPEDEELVDEEVYKVETISKNDDDWGGEDIDANNDSDADGVDLNRTFYLETDDEGDDKEDI